MLDRHGFTRGDDQHAGRAIGLIGDLARICEGTQDHPAGTSNQAVPPSPEPPARTAVRGHPPGLDIKTVLAALDDAADYKRDRAEICADCPDQSCPTCQSRLRDAQDYDQLAARILQAAEAARAAHSGQPEPSRRPPARPAADKEAGQ